ncbi:PREDICTED: blue-sensitive opsin P467-like [Wasmannia auropunctata]|uniref:blue-sensitive opsin P467-like n=1 Tax=Wasmannia auropunctata TaxID=64793 RepID=UPI0005F02F1D|nr:PREDICTED: blue-sensitive opsin P467-like [Wasmannia auropunctata]
MSKIYDMSAVHTQNPCNIFSLKTDLITSTSPTKMNIIIPIIPASVRNIMDFTLVVAGISLNAFLGLFIVLNSTMHTSTNCYIVSLVLSNFVILLEPLERVFHWIFDIHLEMNLDYIFLVSFATSILTIILLNIEAYVVICQKNSPLRKLLLKNSTAIKGILFIWTMCIMASAIELNLYDHFVKEIMYDIYVSSTVMFLLFPCLIFVLLDYFIIYDLKRSKSITGTWPSKDVKRFIFLVGVNIGFFLTVAPYRIVRAIALITQTYYNNMAIEITYTMVKMYPIILPIIYFIISKEFRQLSRDKTAVSMEPTS